MIIQPGTANLPITTKGDLAVGGSTGAAVRLPVGADTQVLTADSTQADGMKWATGGGGVTWPLANAGDETFQPSGVTNNALTLHNNVSAVNGLALTGTAAGAAPTIAAVGTDANIGISYTVKGSGTHIFNATVQVPGGGPIGLDTSTSNGILGIGFTNAATIKIVSASTTGQIIFGSQANFTAGRGMLTLNSVGAMANGLTVTGAVTGASPSLAATGADPNVDLTIMGQGTGVINVGYGVTAISGSIGAATLATTTGGATGPATAAQNSWLAVKINGTVSYIPVWR